MKIDSLEFQQRAMLKKAKRIVVKIGTHVLVNKQGIPNQKRIASIANDLVQLKKTHHEVVLVSSGAIGAGLHTLGFKKRPTALYDLQMAAAVGQLTLLNCYHHYFSKLKTHISQVLLTHADLKDRKRHLNARNTILNLLAHDVIPIINENDVVADDEIKIGDNDVLSALTAELIDADLLIMLTTPDGLRKTVKHEQTRRVPYLENVNQAALELVGEKTNALSIGGMGSKLQAAQIAAKMGALVVIASGKQKNSITRVANGEDVGTLIGNKNAKVMLRKRKRWIAYFHRAKGKLTIDSGAEKALLETHCSLLPVGIQKISGEFSIGDLLDVVTPTGEVIARGLSEYTSQELKKIIGKPSKEIIEILTYNNNNAAIHKDNLVIVKENNHENTD